MVSRAIDLKQNPPPPRGVGALSAPMPPRTEKKEPRALQQ
jgi:hypothetical protein